MGLLRDRNGDMDLLDLGNVSLLEAGSFTVFFVAVASIFSDFDVTIPTGENSTVTMVEELATYDLPLFGSAVFTLGLLIALVLFIYQVVDASVQYGNGRDPQLRDWFDSIPTGLTLGVVGVALLHFAKLFEYAPVLDIVTGGIAVEFATVTVATVVYMALSSQG